MRIGVDATSLLCTEPRGEGKALLRLYCEIARLRPDFSFVLFGVAGVKCSDLWQAIPRAEVVRFDLPGYRWNTWENVGLPWHAWHARCDALHCTSSGGPRFSRVPVIMTVHDLIPLLVDDGQSAAQREYFRRRLANGMHTARAVIAVSHHTRSDLIQSFPDADVPVEVIHWGSEPLEQGAARPLEADYVLALGGAAPRKNVPAAVRAFAGVAAANPSLRLVILGMSRPTARDELLTMGTELGVADRLVIPGFVSEADLAAWYRHALCLCYLSLYEGFGLPLLEAMSCGVPVVASARSSIPEVVGDSGLLVDPDDVVAVAGALDRLLRDYEFRRELGLKAQSHASLFSWQRTAEATIAMLTRAANGR